MKASQADNPKSPQLTLPVPNCLINQRDAGGIRGRSAGRPGLREVGAVDTSDADLSDVNFLLDPALPVTGGDVLGIGREELNLPPAELECVRHGALVEGIG